MISIILTGRNDNYGYNLHKRASISLNCMAQMLTHDEDEILFVDYNTPDDFPTFPEAIEDTLTENARKRLRILRVRPSVHVRFQKRSPLNLLDNIARNVAVRRSNSKNKWLLSSTTDIIFVPKDRYSLSDLVVGLEAGLYHSPRFELPESFWEGMDRKKPDETINAIRQWSTNSPLNEVVFASEIVRYDGPGDCQLIYREDFLKIHGFNEAMLLGWHEDSNIAKRLSIFYGILGDLRDSLSVYHCDHTRQVTPRHSYRRVSNDWGHFVDEVNTPYLQEQADHWGCIDQAIEEIRLDEKRSHHVFMNLFNALAGSEVKNQIESTYLPITYDRGDYDSSKVILFLSDLFTNLPKDWSVGWFGFRDDTLQLFHRSWMLFEFSGKILVDQETKKSLNSETASLEKVSFRSRNELLSSADIFVFDFGIYRINGIHEFSDNDSCSQHSSSFEQMAYTLKDSFLNAVSEEWIRIKKSSLPLRRIIGVNPMHNQFDRLFHSFIASAGTPFGTHLRHGYVDFLPENEERLTEMLIGPAGKPEKDGITICKRPGTIIQTPFIRGLIPGRYQMTFKLDLRISIKDLLLTFSKNFAKMILKIQQYKPVSIEIRSIGTRGFTISDGYYFRKSGTELKIEFSVVPENCASGIELQIITTGHMTGMVQSLKIRRLGPLLL